MVHVSSLPRLHILPNTHTGKCPQHTTTYSYVNVNARTFSNRARGWYMYTYLQRKKWKKTKNKNKELGKRERTKKNGRAHTREGIWGIPSARISRGPGHAQQPRPSPWLPSRIAASRIDHRDRLQASTLSRALSRRPQLVSAHRRRHSTPSILYPGPTNHAS